ncbi:MAG: alpha/beta hydrolase [Rhodoferax sp.]|nr:alpha/beta hydrolase [Rhodoferax sp.]
MNIGCKVHGYGPTKLLLLHGWLSDHSIYSNVLGNFDHDRFSVALMDYRGYGMSSDKNGDFTLDEVVEDALHLTEALGWKSFHVIGHSMGGMVAQKMALRAPERLVSLIAITPVPSSGFALDTATQEFFESSATSDQALTEIFNTLTGKRHSTKLLQDLTKSARASSTTPAFLAYLQEWTKTDFSETTQGLATPTLVIGGKHDGAIGQQLLTDTYLRRLPNAHLVMIDGAGHYPMIETPLEFYTLLDQHLTQLGA